jgi:hypothetical protein
MNGTEKYVPRAQKTALLNTVLGSGRGHANLATWGHRIWLGEQSTIGVEPHMEGNILGPKGMHGIIP